MGMIEIFCVLNYLVLLGNIAVAKGADIRCYEGSPFKYSVYPLDDLTPILSSPTYQRDRKTVFYVFGFNSFSNGADVYTLVQLYLDKANICLLNWEKEASAGILGPIAYLVTAIPNAMRVGHEFGESLIELHNAGLNLADVHIIGTSLGGQLAGYTGRKVQEYDNNVGRITGLDPAGPFYDGILSARQLSASDASFVDIIHTNPGRLGSREASGTVDIWVNCGSNEQPGCNESSLGLFSNLCSHLRALQYFAEAIERSYAFEARAASDCNAWKAGQGTDQTIFMGEDIDTDARGDFYLRTNSYSFFGLGKEGSQPALCQLNGKICM